MIRKRHSPLCVIALSALSVTTGRLTGQESKPGEPKFRITVDVNMVQLSVAVTDNKGNYVSSLRPQDFAVFEDGIQEKLAIFGEENEIPRRLTDSLRRSDQPKRDSRSSRLRDGGGGRLDVPSSPLAGADVFILFDSSNYMYRSFVFAQDAISEFIRSLERPNRVAFYSYSRDLSRTCLLTSERSRALRAVRTTVAGDDAALYNALMMTLRDAEQFTGKRAVVVFSNGPDNASMVAPEDVRELAESEGIPIYMVSTQQARIDPVSTVVFERVSASTGGKAYFAKDWREQQKAFGSIRDDLAHLYSLSYYPQPNPNRGWRSISVRLLGESSKKYHIRTRTGYRPQLVRVEGQAASLP